MSDRVEGSLNAKACGRKKQLASPNTVQRSFDSACGLAQDDNGGQKSSNWPKQ